MSAIPVAQMVGQETSLQERAELREELGLNDAAVVQFGRYVGDIARAGSESPTPSTARSRI